MPESALITTAIGTSLTAIAGVVGVVAKSWTRRQAEDERTRAFVSTLLQERADDLEGRLDAESNARKADRAACEERERGLSDRLRTLEIHHAVCGLVSVPPVQEPRYPRDPNVTPTDAEWRVATEADRATIERLRRIP